MDWTTQVGIYVLGHCLLTGKLSVTIRASKETFQVPEGHLEGTNRDGPWWIESNWQEQGATLTNGTVSLSLFPLAREHVPPKTPAHSHRQGARADSGSPSTPPPLTVPQSVGLRLGKRKASVRPVWKPLQLQLQLPAGSGPHFDPAGWSTSCSLASAVVLASFGPTAPARGLQSHSPVGDDCAGWLQQPAG